MKRKSVLKQDPTASFLYSDKASGFFSIQHDLTIILTVIHSNNCCCSEQQVPGVCCQGQHSQVLGPGSHPEREACARRRSKAAAAAEKEKTEEGGGGGENWDGPVWQNHCNCCHRVSVCSTVQPLFTTTVKIKQKWLGKRAGPWLVLDLHENKKGGKAFFGTDREVDYSRF